MNNRWKRAIQITGLMTSFLLIAVLVLVRTETVSSWLAAKQAQLKYNWVYTKGTDLFSHEPSAFMLECIQGIAPGQALDVAMGQGRNAIALARRGWTVTGFDVSDEGLNVARLQALQLGLHTTTVEATCQSFDYGHNRWDLVLMIYTPMPFHHPGLLARLKESIKPVGLVVVETFLDWSPESGVPRVDGLTGPGELSRLFSDFEIVHDREFEGCSDWFPRKSRLIQFCARKKTSL